jgi:selenium metabolism protein YedF
MVGEVDARGLPCPEPVVRARKALQEAGGAGVTVLVDSPESRVNVTRFAESQGCHVECVEKNGCFELSISRGEPVAVEAWERASVVFITTDRLGTGDRRLGEILMKAFLNTLWEAEPRPERLMFINDGVRLTIEGSEVLETLELLEKAGVRILSCGTCLEFYGLKDRLRVGEVTNMYDTVDSLLSAEKVIKI